MSKTSQTGMASLFLGASADKYILWTPLMYLSRCDGPSMQQGQQTA